MMGLGAACCFYSYQLVNFFWRVEWAERNLGGTRNAIVLGGMLVVVLWVLMVFGMFSLTPWDQAFPTL